MADTGVDLNHCHFREDYGDSIVASDYENPVTDTSKRKVVQYIDFVDDFDGERHKYIFSLIMKGIKFRKCCWEEKQNQKV